MTKSKAILNKLPKPLITLINPTAWDKKDLHIKVSKNYQIIDVVCPCGCGLMPNPLTFSIFQYIQKEFGTHLNIKKFATCSNYNLSIGGTKTSHHTTGEAVDILSYGNHTFELIKTIYKVNLEIEWIKVHIIAPYKDHIHLSICEIDRIPIIIPGIHEL